MGLAEQQAALARLYTSAALRERFLSDPVGTAGYLGLAEEDAAELARLDVDRLRHFARSLVNKRLNDVSKCLPLAQRALGAAFAERFREYAADHASPGPPREDARRFAAALAAATGLEPPWGGELARYEVAIIESHHPRRWCAVMRFRFPVHQLAAHLERGEPPSRAAGQVLVIWMRLPRSTRVRRWVHRLPRG
jgi:hypothetical protein